MTGWGGRREGAGRRQGSRNKSTVAVEETLARAGCDPIQGLAFIATNNMTALDLEKPVPINLRVKALTELAGYVAPKRRSIEASTPGETLLDVLVAISAQPKLIEEPLQPIAIAHESS